MRSAELQYHPNSSIFSLLDGDEDAALVESIKKNGIRERIVIHQGMVLEGRNRYRAARKLHLSTAAIPLRTFDPEKEGDPIDFVWDENVNRRHLNETQRGMAATEMETLRHGGKRNATLDEKPATRMEFARRCGIGHGTMQSMSVVRDRGVPELKEIARAGRISVRTALCIAEMLPDKQKAIIEQVKDVSDRNRAKALQVEAFKEIQRAKLADIGKANRALDPAGKTYDVIYADPAWQFNKEITGNAWAIENHYPTMSIEDICALPVAELAAKHAILFTWVTDHHLIELERVLAAWGFKRRARMVWVKDWIGLGRFVRNRHEYLIIATRGDFPVPPTDCVPDSVIMHPKGKHSVKPPLHEMIEKMTPGLDRKIELFARSRVPGWEAWGNQVDGEEPADVR